MKNWTTGIIVIIAVGVIIGLLVTGGSKQPPTPENATASDTSTTPSDTGSTKGENPTPQKDATPQNSVIVKNGMKIETTHEGTGPAISNGQTAVVDYVGKLENGTIFDASKNHGQDFEFQVGAGQVIKGWDQGVLGMKVGETRILTIPSDLAYGPNGIPGVIPGGATLIFEVTLHGIK